MESVWAQGCRGADAGRRAGGRAHCAACWAGAWAPAACAQRRAGRDLGGAVDDDLVARGQSLRDLPFRSLHGAGLHRTLLRLAVGRDQHLGLSVGAAHDGALRHEDGVALHALLGADAHVHARQQQSVGIAELATQHHLARARIHRNVGEQQLALGRVAGAVDAHADRRLGLRPGRRLAQLEQRVDGLAEVGIDRIELLDQRHGRGFALAHQTTLGHQAPADAARDRRAHAGIAQVELGGLDVGLRRHLVGLGGLQGGDGIVVFLAADGRDLHQRLVAIGQRLGLADLGLGPRQRPAPASAASNGPARS